MATENNGPIERFISLDSGFAPYRGILENREAYVRQRLQETLAGQEACSTSADWHLRHGLFRCGKGWEFREWLPHARRAWLVGEFSNWKKSPRYLLHSEKNGHFSRTFSLKDLQPGQLYKLHVEWAGGSGERLPAESTIIHRSTQELHRGDVLFCSVVPSAEETYVWKYRQPQRPANPLIYETHIGMAQEKDGIGTFNEFRTNILPKIYNAGYNIIQMMGVMEHPYYASFGYHVSNFYAVTDLFGTPDEFKQLVDEAHGMGLAVIIDLVHSHAAPNVNEGITQIDGTDYAYFHSGARGTHSAWGSRCFDYGKKETRQFLASNCRFWLEEYHLDGFRFDGVTSMLYQDHGLGHGVWGYDEYFSPNVDWDAYAYLCYANSVIHEVNPNAITIAEDVSGFPGLTVAREDGGCGFDYRLAMGVTDYWFKLTDIPDEFWPMGTLWYELTGKRKEEHCISYVESHDQALVGGKTLLFTLIGAAMYDSMSVFTPSQDVDRGIALHKMARLISLATADSGYLSFMGNEFGHPEWIDFPCDRNGWSFHHARRQWHLQQDPLLKYHCLSDFDKIMIQTIKAIPDFFTHAPTSSVVDDQAKIIVFYRGNTLFAFNFHPTRSVTDYKLLTYPGKYRLLLDTDQTSFGGFGRVQKNQVFFTSQQLADHNLNNYLQVYLPARTALVLSREP